MTRKKLIVISLFVAASLIFVLSRFYLHIQNSNWSTNAKAVEIAYKQSILAKAIKVEAFHGDESFHVIHGEDKIGQPIIVWVSGQADVHTEMVEESFKEEQIREIMQTKQPDAELLRIMPGKLRDQFVWEVFYKKQEAAGQRYYYDYYQFHDGTYIDTWRLSLQ